MIGFIVKAPLAEGDIGSTILDHLNHFDEVLLLLLIKLLIVFDVGDVDVVLGFGFRGLESAGEDADFGIFHDFGHLRVSHFLVNQDPLDELGVLDGASSLGLNFDQIQVDVLPVQIGHLEH